MRSIYLDYAATTPVDPEVFKTMKLYFAEVFANPSSIHRGGQSARTAIDQSRSTVAKLVGAQPHEIIFTPSATAANNLAIRGLIEFCKTLPAGRQGSQVVQSKVPHIVTSAFEHESVLETVKALEKKGKIEATYVVPTKDGFIRPEDVQSVLRENTVLVSIMYANNEIGTIQPIPEIANVIRDFRKQLATGDLQLARSQKPEVRSQKSALPIFHTDAVQAFQFLDTNVGRLGVDMLTLSAHKVYGPKGVGVLYKKEGVELEPLIYGGGQEFGFVSGTENVANIVGCAKALEIADSERRSASLKMEKLRNYLWDKLQKEFGSDIELNGSFENRLPNNLNVLINPVRGREGSQRVPASNGVDPDILRVGLSEAGIAVSFGSACMAHTMQPSHVLLSIGRTHEEAMRSFRISLGKYTKIKDLDNFVAVLHNVLM